jgi:two-component system chemotaxis sensor kinase CheA
MSDVGDDIVREFLVESYENLDQLDRDFVSLEKNPGSRELLGNVFRTIHTIKGTCGFLGFHRLEALTHAGENLLSLLRGGALVLDPAMTTTLLAMVDAVRAILRYIEVSGQEGVDTYAALIAELVRFQSRAPRSADSAALSNFAPPAESPAPGRAVVSANPAPEPTGPASQSADPTPVAAEAPAPAPPAGETRAASPEPPRRKAGGGDVRLFDPLVRSGRLDPDRLAQAAEQQRRGDPRRIGEILVDQGLLEPHEVLEALVAQQEARAAGVVDGTVRVDVRRLDRLVTLVSELVLARNQILQYVSARDFSALPATSQRLNLITTELQEGIMKTRMQPIGNLWNKLPRLVRDVAAACDKEVRIEMEGRDTELDKTVLEAIGDPITHLVRNAIDHGIESREIRAACGKPHEGRIALRAFHESGKVCIEISDDGAGLPIERIRRKALDRGLVTPQRAAHMTDREWASLVFTPGFSTAQVVTSISGRGVGMDVVKTNIERIGGSVDIQSRPTVGTTVFLKIPLTLAIVPALIVTDDEARFAIPQLGLQELFRIPAHRVAAAIDWVHEAPVYRLRDRILPLVFLRELLNDRRPFTSQSVTRREGRALNVVVLKSDAPTFGLVVDEVNDAEEIVVKPLSEPLKGVTVLAGATILGDGRVALILDVPGMAHVAGLSGTAPPPLLSEPATDRGARSADPLLVVEARAGWRVALPLARIARLEELTRASIESAGARELVQYRGVIVPIVRLTRLLDPHAPDEPWRAIVPAVVVEHRGRRLAIATAGIVDVAEESVDPQPVTGRRGIAASAVLHGRVVDLLDVDVVLDLADRECHGENLAAAGEAA